MNLTHLMYFITVADNASFTKAAEVLYVSQSSVSKMVSDLEQELKLDLFARTKGKKLELTKAGQKLYNEAYHIIEHTKEFMTTASKLKSNASIEILNVGILADLDLLKICPNQLHQFATRYPSIQLRFTTGTESRIIDGLMNNTIDCFIGPDHIANYIQSMLPLDSTVIFKNELVLIADKTLPFDSQISIEENFHDKPFVFYSENGIWDNTTFRTGVSDLLSSGFTPSCVICVDSVNALYTYVLCGYGIGIINSSTRFEHSDLLSRWIIPTESTPNIVISQKRITSNPSLKLFTELFTK